MYTYIHVDDILVVAHVDYYSIWLHLQCSSANFTAHLSETHHALLLVISLSDCVKSVEIFRAVTCIHVYKYNPAINH